jgi:DNA-binding protein HU-beta
MTKLELVKSIALQTGYDRTSIQNIVESAIHNLKKALREGDAMYVRGFGTLSVKKRAAHMGRDIANNITVEVPEHKTATFKPSREFLKLLNK